MAHKSQLENKKYRNWVKAGLGLKYVKEGLEPFCEHLATQQHTDILRKVKEKHNLSAVSCGLCDIRTLKPDHIHTKTKQCPLGQIQCNCKYPLGRKSCANKVCSAIYDEIIKLHASTPPAPCWRNTDAHQWCTEPWSVAKCFINAPGYEQQLRAEEFDCLGLLHVFINNIEFQQHIKCGISGADVFLRVRDSRNEIFHSHTMELEDSEVNSYLDDMMKLLEDEIEIKHRQESKDAVKKLMELKQEDFVISTTDVAEIRRVAMAAISKKEGDLKRKIVEAENKIATSVAKGKRKLEGEGVVIKAELEKKRRTIRRELTIEKEDSEKKLGQKRIEIEKQLTIKECQAEEKLEQKLQESKLQLLNTKTLIEVSIKDNAETKQQADNKRKKAEFQKKLVKLHTKYARSVPSFPLQPKRKQIDVNDIYVPPLMNIDTQDKNTKEWKEVPISMQELFEDTETPAKSIYVLGEAGSGKSIFCKILVHFWCVAHSYPECSLDKSDMVKEMGRFEFLFYVLLRNCSDCGSIEEMLEKLHRDPALGDILQNESSKCLILLDGLDEWTPGKKHNSQFLTQGLPGRELNADYTVITTSRHWKYDALPVSDREVDKKIKLIGIDQKGIEDLIEKTIEMLNNTFCEIKSAECCKTDLKRRPVSDISHIPLILQQLIFLWFDDKLRDDSKHAIYSNMLAIFLEWNKRKSSENQECDMITQERLIYPPLPDYLCMFDIFCVNTHVTCIQCLSHLAYETLFDKNRETSLTFSRSTLLNIPNDVIKFCLNVGILIEEETVSLHASIPQQSSFSFFHISIQEYLAAVFVANQFKEMVNSQKSMQKDKGEHSDIVKKFVLKYFDSCKTVVDILEQSNVFIMLCGLEPRLLTNISEYIYNVAAVDRMVVEERYKVPVMFSSDHNKFIRDIQACILKCIEEVISNEKNVPMPVYIADLYVSPETKLARFGKNIVLENVLSVEIDEILGMTEHDKEAYYIFLGRLSKHDQLKVMKVDGKDSNIDDKTVINAVTKILKTNVSTLETISLIDVGEKMLSLLDSEIPKMRRLVSLQVTSLGVVSHDVCLSLSEFLNHNTTLQHISLNIYCKINDQHTIDLSNHNQLQHVNIGFSIALSAFSMISCKTGSLESCMFNVMSSEIMNQLCNNLHQSYKLTHLYLNGFKIRGTSSLKENREITENLIRLLPSLISLSTLILEYFFFTDNIITCPPDTKNLKEIILIDVAMSMTTWCKFIDSLPALPQSVQVKLTLEHIGDATADENVMQVADALQYVRDKTNLFHVTRSDVSLFIFTTKKVLL